MLRPKFRACNKISRGRSAFNFLAILCEPTLQASLFHNLLISLDKLPMNGYKLGACVQAGVRG